MNKIEAENNPFGPDVIGFGAEAVVRVEENDTGKYVLKERVVKDYRLAEIDEDLRGSRTRREAKVLDKLMAVGFKAPGLIFCDRKSIIKMTYLEGPKVRDSLKVKDGIVIGEMIATLHDMNIIHGDLTTSNMILNKADGEIYFIDFGLSFFSTKEEDMAVDLHLLRQAMESHHNSIWEECFANVLEGYKNVKEDADVVLKRFEQVEARGRNKLKG